MCMPDFVVIYTSYIIKIYANYFEFQRRKQRIPHWVASTFLIIRGPIYLTWLKQQTTQCIYFIKRCMAYIWTKQLTNICCLLFYPAQTFLQMKKKLLYANKCLSTFIRKGGPLQAPYAWASIAEPSYRPGTAASRDENAYVWRGREVIHVTMATIVHHRPGGSVCSVYQGLTPWYLTQRVKYILEHN